MDLKEFIKISLSDVLQGIQEGNKTLGQKYFEMNAHQGDVVEFDIAVTVNNESSKSGGGGLKIAVVELGGSVSDKSITQTVSRIKFKVKAALNQMG